MQHFRGTLSANDCIGKVDPADAFPDLFFPSPG